MRQYTQKEKYLVAEVAHTIGVLGLSLSVEDIKSLAIHLMINGHIKRLERGKDYLPFEGDEVYETLWGKTEDKVAETEVKPSYWLIEKVDSKGNSLGLYFKLPKNEGCNPWTANVHDAYRCSKQDAQGMACALRMMFPPASNAFCIATEHVDIG